MSWTAPSIRWAGIRATTANGRPAVEVPADLSALGGRERELLEARLTWRSGAEAVRVAPGGRPAVAFVGTSVSDVTPGLRDAVDAAVASVAADAAAGWTAVDERERHRPFSWDADATPAERPALAVVPHPDAAVAAAIALHVA